MVRNLEPLKLIDDIPWLSIIGVLLLVPLLFDFNVNLLFSILTDALFLIVLGLELCKTTRSFLYSGHRSAGSIIRWLHAGWMGVTWGLYQLIGLVDLGLLPIRFVLSLVLIGLAIQYFSQREFVNLLDIEILGTQSTPLLILAAFMFINLLGNTSLVTGAIFLSAAGYLLSDENAFAGYLVPLGTLLVGYSFL